MSDKPTDVLGTLQAAIEATETLDLDYDDAIMLSRAMNRAISEIKRLRALNAGAIQ